MSKVTIQGDASGTGIFTIASPNSNTDRTLVLPDEAGTVLTSATPGVPVNGPAFSSYTTVSQNVSANTPTKIQLNAEIFDTNACFDTGSYRFTPNVAGYYQINACIYFTGSIGQYTVIEIYKNSSVYSGINTQRANGNYNSVSWSDIMYMNGSTDYIELYGYDSAACSTLAGQGRSYFSGALVRAA